MTSFSLRPARRHGRRLVDTLVASAAPRSHAIVGHPIGREDPDEEDRGLAIIEMISGYGLYVLVGAIAVAAAAAIYISLSTDKMISDVRALVSATQRLHENFADYSGLTAEVMVDSGLIPDELFDGDVITIAGSQGGEYVIGLWEGRADPALGMRGDRAFQLTVFDIDNEDDCTLLAAANFNRLKGVQLLDQIDDIVVVSGAGVVTRPPVVGPTDGSTVGTNGIAWVSPAPTAAVGPLDARTSAAITANCTALVADGHLVSVSMGFR